MNISGTAVEVTTDIVHHATKFEGTKTFIVLPNCHNILSVHSFQVGTDRKITCRVCRLDDESR